MKQGMMIVSSIAGLVLIGAIGYVATRGSKAPVTNSSTVNVTNQDRVESDGTVVKPDGTMVKPDGTMIKSDGTMVKPDGTMVKPDGTMVKPDGTMVGPDGTVIQESTGASNTNATSTAPASQATYTAYSSSALATAQSSGRTVLYFHAPWCPICVALEPQLKSQIGSFPADVTILKVDYDSSTDLKKKYGVPYQHTFVQVDASGNKLKLWSGGDVEAIKQNII